MGNDQVSERQSQGGLFQSTFPRGERRMSPSDAHDHTNFNPRSRVGNDTCTTTFLLTCDNFNPRSRVGNDISQVSRLQKVCYFNPRSRVGNDSEPLLKLLEQLLFQSTFPRGERLQISTIFHLYICISSTNSHFSITSFCIFYLIHFFLICFFQLFMVRIFWGFSVYFWFALYRNNT